VQDFSSYCRLVTCAKESGGKRLGTSGKKIGNAHLKWAFSEAAGLFLRNNEPGQKYLARLGKKHDQGKALTILAHQLARAVYYMLKRKTAFDMDLFLPTSGSRAGEPEVYLDAHRDDPEARVLEVLRGCGPERQGTPRSHSPEPGALIGPRSGSWRDGDDRPRRACAALPPSLTLTGERQTLRPPYA